MEAVTCGGSSTAIRKLTENARGVTSPSHDRISTLTYRYNNSQASITKNDRGIDPTSWDTFSTSSFQDNASSIFALNKTTIYMPPPQPITDFYPAAKCELMPIHPTWSHKNIVSQSASKEPKQNLHYINIHDNKPLALPIFAHLPHAMGMEIKRMEAEFDDEMHRWMSDFGISHLDSEQSTSMPQTIPKNEHSTIIEPIEAMSLNERSHHKEQLSDLSKAAGSLLDAVAHENGEKWTNSLFLSLMKEFRDGDRYIHNGKITDANEAFEIL